MGQKVSGSSDWKVPWIWFWSVLSSTLRHLELAEECGQMEHGAQLIQSQSTSSQQCAEQTLMVSKDTCRRSVHLEQSSQCPTRVCFHASVHVKSLHLCPTLCDPMDCSPPDSSVQGILQAGILEWIAISFSRGLSQPREWTQVPYIAGRFFTIWDTRDIVLR